MATSNMIKVNESMPTMEVSTPSAKKQSFGLARGPSSSGVGNPENTVGDGVKQPTLQHANTMPADSRTTTPGSGSLLESAMGSMSIGDQEDGVVMPMPASMTAAESADIKEAEARRRTSLAQDLDERGILSTYDPTTNSGPGGGPESSFDIGSLAPQSSEMKNFLLNPSPRNAGMIECRIVRERSGLNKLFPKYVLESDAGIFLMTAKKQTRNKTSNYAITMSKIDNGKDSESDAFLGKLRSNFLGLEFIAYGTGLNPKKIDSTMSQMHMMQSARQELLAVQYSSSLWGGSKPRGPRKMSAAIPHVQPNGERLVCRTLHPETEGLLALQKAGSSNHLIDSYHNKPPKWNEQIGAFVLNFNKRVTQASVKNFQLTNAEDPDTIYLQFGRVGKDTFNMDFRFPFSPFQAFAICLSSFDYKLCCE